MRERSKNAKICEGKEGKEGGEGGVISGDR